MNQCGDIKRQSGSRRLVDIAPIDNEITIEKINETPLLPQRVVGQLSAQIYLALMTSLLGRSS